MTDYEQDAAVLLFNCEKCKSTQFSTEALICLVQVYSYCFLYRIVGSKAYSFI